MTKVIILGKEPEKKKGKPIEFKKYLESDLKIVGRPLFNPSNYKTIEVIVRNYAQNFDLFFAYNNIRKNGVLYLGHYNDGIVE